MPIFAYCTICSDIFDHARDVAAIHCGHTFHYECLLQWFQTAPTKTCPQCRKQVSTRHIINKLFFDIGGEGEEGSADPESLQNEIDRMKALLSSKDRDWREKQKEMDGLKDTVNKQRRDLDAMRKEVMEKEMLCVALKKQMVYLETQQNEIQVAKEEVRRLRGKMKTFEGLNVLLQGQRGEVESMITDMGVSQAAVEQLSIYCISLKKEYDNLTGRLKSSNDMCEKLKREVLSSDSKLQKASREALQLKEELKSLQKDLVGADKEISSLKKKVEFLQKTLSTPTRTNEALSRLVFESPAPLELKPPSLHQPAHGDDIDLNMTYDIATPDVSSKRSAQVPSKKMRLERPGTSSSKYGEKLSCLSKNEDSTLDPFLRNSLLFRKKILRSMLDPQKKAGVVQTGYDGLGGRTKFIQPSPLSEIRPLLKAKRKKVTRPPSTIPTCPTLDSFLE
ncbi:E3 ubiquitin-protein ligase TRAIP [Xiphophorus maculatus]|uniref:TRAF-interacting protein n=1 Tax=Xiphophorus maculatus TaxID=8083 RepID=M3ZIW8_XIPMA|nr:E3 ubiquitin-protein ligase TRAIP [Xiphophorus maculatus]